MDITQNLIVETSLKDETKNKLELLLKELELDFEITEEPIQFTKLNITLKLNTLKAIKHLFSLVHAPEEEIKHLAKLPSIIKTTGLDLITTAINNIKKRG